MNLGDYDRRLTDTARAVADELGESWVSLSYDERQRYRDIAAFVIRREDEAARDVLHAATLGDVVVPA
jgi:hypothetical protein